MKRREILQEPFQICDVELKDMLIYNESHHKDLVVFAEPYNGLPAGYYWVGRQDVIDHVNSIGYENAIELLEMLGFNQNDEVYKRLHRNMGMNLADYHQLFYKRYNNKGLWTN